MNSSSWETVGNDGKAIKKVGIVKVDAKKEAASKKRFQEKAPKLQDFREFYFSTFRLSFFKRWSVILVPYNDVANVYSSSDKSRSQSNGTGSGSGSGAGSPAKAKKAPIPKKVEKKDTTSVESKPRNIDEASKKVALTN